MDKKPYEINLTLNVLVTDEDIDDIMVGALEGGINYWCGEAEVVGDKYLGEFASEQISRGGELRLYDCESDDSWVIDKEKILKGIQKWLEWVAKYENLNRAFYHEKNCIRLDCCNIDGRDCDKIVQYAAMGELVFG